MLATVPTTIIIDSPLPGLEGSLSPWSLVLPVAILVVVLLQWRKSQAGRSGPIAMSGLGRLSLLAVVVGACGGPASEACVEVHAETVSQAGAGPLGAVAIDEGWILATPAGAAWVTFDDPSVSSGRLILPLNDAAWEASIAGVDIQEGARLIGV